MEARRNLAMLAAWTIFMTAASGAQVCLNFKTATFFNILVFWEKSTGNNAVYHQQKWNAAKVSALFSHSSVSNFCGFCVSVSFHIFCFVSRSGFKIYQHRSGRSQEILKSWICLFEVKIS